jgi:hypothetical protein
MSGEFDDLPEDPEMAFAEFVLRDKETYSEQFQLCEDNGAVRALGMLFVSRVMAFHRAHSLELISDPRLARSTKNFTEEFNAFWDNLTSVTTEIDVRHAYRLRRISTILELPPEIRQSIHNAIEQIRSLIVPLNLREKKKEALLNALSAFSREVDHQRTKTEAWTSFGLELATAAEEGGKKFKPIRDLVDSVSTMLGKAKELGDRLGLPTRDKPKQIEGPKKQLPKPEDFADGEPF